MDTCQQDVERIWRQVPLLRKDLEALKADLIGMQLWADAHPEAPHPADAKGPMRWEVVGEPPLAQGTEWHNRH